MTGARRIACTVLVAASAFFAAGVASAGQQQDMMARMAARESLTALAAQMNAAAGEAKINAMAALLNAMLDEQKAMRAAMMGGAEKKDKPMCAMMNDDKPAASTDSPAHVHP